MKCSFCQTDFSCRSSMINHQKTAKYCLRLQKEEFENIEENEDEKDERERESEKEREKEIEKMKEKIQQQEKEIEHLRYEREKLIEKINKQRYYHFTPISPFLFPYTFSSSSSFSFSSYIKTHDIIL